MPGQDIVHGNINPLLHLSYVLTAQYSDRPWFCLPAVKEFRIAGRDLCIQQGLPLSLMDLHETRLGMEWDVQRFSQYLSRL